MEPHITADHHAARPLAGMAATHTPGPWRTVPVETPDYYTHQIEIAESHIASVVGWSAIGSVCPVTEANARLIEHAPDMADALRALLDWAAMTGGWDAPCWEQARRVLAHASPPGLPDDPDVAD